MNEKKNANKMNFNSKDLEKSAEKVNYEKSTEATPMADDDMKSANEGESPAAKMTKAERKRAMLEKRKREAEEEAARKRGKSFFVSDDEKAMDERYEKEQQESMEAVMLTSGIKNKVMKLLAPVNDKEDLAMLDDDKVPKKLLEKLRQDARGVKLQGWIGVRDLAQMELMKLDGMTEDQIDHLKKLEELQQLNPFGMKPYPQDTPPGVGGETTGEEKNEEPPQQTLFKWPDKGAQGTTPGGLTTPVSSGAMGVPGIPEPLQGPVSPVASPAPPVAPVPPPVALVPSVTLVGGDPALTMSNLLGEDKLFNKYKISLKGVKEADDVLTWINQIQEAKQRHPSYAMRNVVSLIDPDCLILIKIWVEADKGDEDAFMLWEVNEFLEYLLEKCPEAKMKRQGQGATGVTTHVKKMMYDCLKKYVTSTPGLWSDLLMQFGAYHCKMRDDESWKQMNRTGQINQIIYDKLEWLASWNRAIEAMKSKLDTQKTKEEVEKMEPKKLIGYLSDMANKMYDTYIEAKDDGNEVSCGGWDIPPDNTAGAGGGGSEKEEHPVHPKKDKKSVSQTEKPSGGDHASEPKPRVDKPKKEGCRQCGRAGHVTKDCFMGAHPDINRTSAKWLDSPNGKAYKAINNWEFLCNFLQLTPDKKGIEKMPVPIINPFAKEKNDKFFKKKGESACMLNLLVEGGSPVRAPDVPYTVSEPGGCNLQVNSLGSTVQETSEIGVVPARDWDVTKLIAVDDSAVRAQVITKSGAGRLKRHDVNMMIDTGARPYSYCNNRVKELALRQGHELREVRRHTKLADDSYITTNNIITVTLHVYNLIEKDFKTVEVDCLVMNSPDKDLIIGLAELRRTPILRQVLFADICKEEDITWISQLLEYYKEERARNTKVLSDKQILESRLHQIEQDRQDEDEQREAIRKYEDTMDRLSTEDSVRVDATASKKKRRVLKNKLQSTLEMRVAEIEDGLEDLNDIPFEVHEEEDEGSNIPTKIEGTEELKKALIELCKKYEDCFDRSLRPEAALLPPMELQVADTWDTKENRRPPRPQGRAKEKEIKEQTDKMIEAKVIRHSTASAHSQVLLIPKPDGSWRFCIDYRRLNAETKGTNWPIPNIRQMLNRIGERKPKWFGIIDLTKGYYQAPLSEKSKHLTAFITACELFEWNRVPMGLMGAPSYFQKMMCTHVLGGLLHNACEVYMDDVIIFGKDEDEYLKNLESVLMRLRRFKLTGNPDKTKLGLRQIEYVGHVIDDSGTSFKRERLQEVIDFPKPEVAGELKKFIGVANYIRDNIPKMSELIAPLTGMLPPRYNKKMKHMSVKWTPESIEAFEKLKEAINECQKLFFMEDDCEANPVHLFTDASKIGVGAYLCQKVGDQWHVIAFMSKLLTKTQQNWSTPEREAFAIYEAFRKFEYLLRDIHFVLHTDHLNLIYVRDTGSAKVINWKLLIQEFDFEISYVKGELNVMADRLSRNPAATMCAEEEENRHKTDLSQLDLGDSNWPLMTDVRMEGELCVFDGILTQKEHDILSSVHNATVGHHGVDNTMRKLKQANQKFPYMRNKVDKFVKECDCCQKSTPNKYHNDMAAFTTVGMELMETVNIDNIGPLEPDRHGNTHITVIVDKFSRWMELYPSTGADAISSARALLAFYGRFGIPKKITSDRGSEYCNELINHFHKTLGIAHQLTIAYSHEENSVVERANKEVRQYLNDICYDRRLSKSQWSDNIPLIMRVYNSIPKEMTKCSPAHMIYAGSLSLNQRLFLENNTGLPLDVLETHNKSWEEWWSERIKAQQLCIEIAQKETRDHIERHLREDSGKRTEYPIGSYVLKAYPPSKYGGGRPSKQDMYLQGPYQVHNNEDKTYYLRDLKTGKVLEPCNIKLLRPFMYDKSRTNPTDISLKDSQDMYIVEEVLGHSGNFNRKDTLHFRVKWSGYLEPTIASWEDMRDNLALHEYLIKTGNEKYIPNKFKSK